MRFVEVNGIYGDICPLKLMKRIIGGEDKFVTQNVLVPSADYVGFGRRIVMRLSRVNMKNRSVGDELQILAGELLAQENTGTNHNNSLWFRVRKLTNSIKDTHVSFSRAGWHHYNTFRMLLESIQGSLLVRAKLEHHQSIQYSYYKALLGKTQVPCATFSTVHPLYFP
jgi:hypothetical protein